MGNSGEGILNPNPSQGVIRALKMLNSKYNFAQAVFTLWISDLWSVCMTMIWRTGTI